MEEEKEINFIYNHFKNDKEKYFNNKFEITSLEKLLTVEEIKNDEDKQTQLLLFDKLQDYLIKHAHIKNHFELYYGSIERCYQLVEILYKEKATDDSYIYHSMNWLKTCVDYNKSEEAQSFFLGKNPEEEVKKIICLDSGRRLLKLEFLPPNKLANINSHLYKWFLRRYEFDTAEMLLDAIQNRIDFFHKSFRYIYRGITKFIPMVLFLSVMVAVLPLMSFFNNIDIVLPIFPLTQLPSVFEGIIKSGNSLLTTFIIAVYLIAIFGFGFMTVNYFNDRKEENRLYYFELLLPRLFTGVLIGFLPLVVSLDVWQIVLNIGYLPYFVLISFILAVGFILMRIRILREVGSKNEPTKRALFVVSWGLFISYITGLIICDLITIPVIQGLIQNSADIKYCKTVFVSGVFGIIIPKILIFFSVLSFVIGLFVQLIWEEKSISHSL